MDDVNHSNYLSEVKNIETKGFSIINMNFINNLAFCIISGGIAARFFQRRFNEEKVLRDSEEKYRNIFENIQDMYYETLIDGTILVMSPSIENILGYTADEVIGKNIIQIYAWPEERQSLLNLIKEKGYLTNYEVKVKRKDNNLCYLWFNLKIVTTNDGITKIIGIARDITDIKKAEELQRESELKYKALYERMLNGFVIMEPVYNDKEEIIDYRYIDMNPAAVKLSGYSRDGFIGKQRSEIQKKPGLDLDQCKEILEKGISVQYENYNPVTNLYHLSSAFKVKENQIGIVFDNVTPYKKALQEIEILNKDLEKRVEERTFDLQSALTELEAFNYTVSHDLKSPLRAIEGYCRFILNEYEQELHNEVRKMITNIRKISNEMIDLIHKLLSFSTTTKLELTKEKVDIEELFYSAFNEMKVSYRNRNIVLTIEGKIPNVEGDKVLLKQVISNIYSNSYKFTKYREKAIIKIKCKQCRQGYLFSIEDNGVGFEMEYAGNIFGMFQRLHSQKEFEGDGIGLSTVRKIIQKHGGRVWIEGEVNKGATVYFTLPSVSDKEKNSDLGDDN